MFSKFFRGCKEAPTSSAEKLKQTLELLEEKEAVLQKKISQEVDRAKEYTKAKNKQGVLDCMKRKKFYEGQMEQLGAFQSLIRNKEQRLSQKVPMQCRQGMSSKSKSSLGNARTGS